MVFPFVDETHNVVVVFVRGKERKSEQIESATNITLITAEAGQNRTEHFPFNSRRDCGGLARPACLGLGHLTPLPRRLPGMESQG